MAVSQAEFQENKKRITELLEKLRNKLKSFAIVNLQGQLIGYIKDFCLDKSRRLYMIVSQVEAQPDSPLFLLSSKYIQKIDTANQLLFVDLSLGKLDQLPVYQPTKDNMVDVSEQSLTSSMAQTNMASSREGLPPNESQPLNVGSLGTESLNEEDHETTTDFEEEHEVVEEEIVRLLEERLVVNRSKRKVGEVVVRKEIETRMVQIPVQREVLIIEQVGEETKQLAEIDLGHGEVTGVELAQAASAATVHRAVPSSDNPYTVTGEFLSPRAASNLLDAIALQKRHGCSKVRVELVVDNPELQENYQKMFDRCSKG